MYYLLYYTQLFTTFNKYMCLDYNVYIVMCWRVLIIMIKVYKRSVQYSLNPAKCLPSSDKIFELILSCFVLFTLYNHSRGVITTI